MPYEPNTSYTPPMVKFAVRLSWHGQKIWWKFFADPAVEWTPISLLHSQSDQNVCEWDVKKTIQLTGMRRPLGDPDVVQLGTWLGPHLIRQFFLLGLTQHRYAVEICIFFTRGERKVSLSCVVIGGKPLDSMEMRFFWAKNDAGLGTMCCSPSEAAFNRPLLQNPFVMWNIEAVRPSLPSRSPACRIALAVVVPHSEETKCKALFSEFCRVRPPHLGLRLQGPHPGRVSVLEGGAWPGGISDRMHFL